MKSRLTIGAFGVLGLIFTVSAAEPGGENRPLKNPMVFPGKDWVQASPESQGIKPAKLKAAIDYLDRSLSEYGGARTVFIVRNGYAIWQGPESDREFQIYSATKSFTSTVLGLLIEDGKVSLNTLAKDVEPALAGQYPGVTLRHFATMTSGYDSVGGSYEFDSEGRGDSWNPGPPATAIFPPGTKFRYWDDAIMQFGNVLTKAAGQPLDQLFKARISEPIGMTHWHWAQHDSATGRVLGWTGGIHTSSRELARFGHLLLNRGNWNGRQLLSKEAVRQITTDAGTPGICGIGCWSNNSGHCAKLPKDAFWGSGAGHQVVLVVPSLNLIAVRNGEVLGAVPAEPNQYHEPLRQFLFEPLVEAISDMTDVPLCGRFETAVTNACGYANPFADFVLRATFTRPDKSQVPFSGFHDGDGNGGQTGNMWKLRFMPDQVGAWFYECSFSDGAPGRSGMFYCVADGAKPGPLPADPANRRCWVFADGSRFSARAYTAPELFVAENETDREYWIDYFFGTKYKFNLCNANLLNFVGVKEMLNWQGTPYKAPDPTQDGKYVTIPGNGLLPFVYSGTRPLFDGGSNVDWLRPSVRCWANVDKVLGELEAHRVVWFNHWGMVGWDWSGNGRLLVPPASRKPVLRCWIARLAPYWNVIWNIAGEWEEFLTPAELDDLGDFIKEMDPWKHPLTSHPLGTTVDRPWVDFRVRGDTYPSSPGDGPSNDFRNDLTGGYLAGGFVRSMFVPSDRLEWFLATTVPAIKWGKVEYSRSGKEFAITDPVVQVPNPAIDRGARLPGFNDDYQGSAPDIGAFENGNPPLRFGREAAPGFTRAPWELY
jgi:CubicO group peptidase (beta-lactamase class C family)